MSMKNKTQPINVNSGNYLYQALMIGLTEEQKAWAESEVKKCEKLGVVIPYGVIRKCALETQ